MTQKQDDDGNLYRIIMRDGHIVMILAQDPVQAGSYMDHPEQIKSIELFKLSFEKTPWRVLAVSLKDAIDQVGEYVDQLESVCLVNNVTDLLVLAVSENISVAEVIRDRARLDLVDEEKPDWDAHKCRWKFRTCMRRDPTDEEMKLMNPAVKL